MFVFDFFESLTGAIFNTNAHKFNKLVKYFEYKYHDDEFKELPSMLENFDINTCNKDGKNLLHIFSCKNKIMREILLNYVIVINK